MNLVERIETTRFLGSEFLCWLWFKTELFEGELERPDKSTIEVWLDSQLVLQAANDKNERTTLKGVAPSATKEARLALVCGKSPLRARVCMTSENQEFSFIFDALSFSMGAVNLPQVLLDEDDDAFFERMRLLERLDEMWRELYAEFLGLRVSTFWRDEFVPALREWSKGNEPMTTRGYRGLLQRATK
jgi:hypothetical protein